MNNNCLTEEQIARYIDGLASDEEIQLIIKHCRNCYTCSEDLSMIIGYSIFKDDGYLEGIELRDPKVIDFPKSENFSGNKSDADNPQNISYPFFENNANFINPNNISHHQMPMVGTSENNFNNYDRNIPTDDSIIKNQFHHHPLNNSDMESQINHNSGHFGEEANINVSSHVFQGYSDTCAIRSQQLIMNDFGIPVTQEDLINEASQNGWYSEGSGTPMNDVGNLLENHGIEVNRVENANIYNLTNELAQGHKVIIGVDANELWHNSLLQDIKDTITGETPNHALIVAGIDTSDPNHVQVILTDPGTGDVAKAYPLDQFLDAWHDSGNYMVSTKTPAPLAYNPEMINFDYTQGHLPSIGNMPFDYFNDHFLNSDLLYTMDGNLNETLYHDFINIVNGDFSNISPELLNTLDHLPTHPDTNSSMPENNHYNSEFDSYHQNDDNILNHDHGFNSDDHSHNNHTDNLHDHNSHNYFHGSELI